jgi:hypothetical protein
MMEARAVTKKCLAVLAAALLLVLSSQARASTDTSSYATLPTGTGGCGGWTCSGSSNEVDILGTQGDSKFMYHNADTAGDSLSVYGFAFSGIPSGSVINSVKVSYYAKKNVTGGIPQWLNAKIWVGTGSYVTSPNQTTTVSWTEYYWTSTTRPGGGAWTWDDVQNLQLSFSVPGGGDATISQNVDRAYLTVNWQVIGLADRQYQFCDPYASKFCSGLVALYEFEEATDYDRTSETGSARLLEPDGVNVPRTTGKTGSGPYAFQHQAVANSYLYIPRTVGFSGTFTINFWIHVATGPSADGKEVYLATIKASGAARYPLLELIRVSGTTYVRYTVKQSITDTLSYVQVTMPLDANFHEVAFGGYPTPTQTEPFQWTLWMQVDGGTRATQTVTYPGVPSLGDLIIGGWSNTSPVEYGAYELDQLGVWSWAWSPGDVSTFYGSGTARAFPFSGFGY